MRFLCSHIMFGRTCTDGTCKDYHPTQLCIHGSNCEKGVFCSFRHTEEERMRFLIESRSTSPSSLEGDNSTVSSVSSTSVTADSTNSWCPMVSQRTNKTYYYNKKTRESTYNTSDVTLSLSEVDRLIKVDRENNARILAKKDQEIRELYEKLEAKDAMIVRLHTQKSAPKKKTKAQLKAESDANLEESFLKGEMYALGTKRPRNN